MNDTPLHAFRIERSGPLTPDSQMLLSQALSTSLSTAAAGTTMSARCTPEGTIERVFTSSGANAVDRAFQIAKAFNSRSESVDPPALEAAHIAVLEFGHDSALAAATQAGTSLTSVAEAIDAYLTASEWIAVSVRKPEPKERSRWNTWHDFHRPGAVSTHSRRSDAVVISIHAGSHAPERAQNALRQFHSALGGFELIPEAQMIDGRAERRTVWRVAGVAGLVGVAATAARHFWASIEETIGTTTAATIEPALLPAQLLGFGVAAAATVAAVLHQYGYLPSAAKRARALLGDGLAPPPAKRSGAPKKPKAATTTQKIVDGVAQLIETPRQDGDYPLSARAFMVGSELAAAVLLPGSSARSGVSSTASRELPSAVRNVHGPEIGTSDGQVAKLSSADLWAGVFVIGKAGSGKSKLLEWLWAWMQSQLSPLQHAKGYSAYNGAMIAFDTKDDGKLSANLREWGTVTGVRTTVVDVASDTPMPVSIFDSSGTLRQRSERVLDALSHLIGEAAGPRFRETAGVVIPLAMLVDAAVTNAKDWLPQGASVFAYAHILTGSRGTEKARELFQVIREQHFVESASEDVSEAIQAGENLYGDRVTDTQFKNLVESTRNKLDSFTYTEQFWRAGQRDDAASWEYLLTSGQSIALNFEGLGDRAIADVAQLIMFTLRAAVQKHCKGFQEQGRTVTLLADEASIVAEHSPEIIEWFRSKGRSFGCRMILATQQPTQLPQDVRRSLLGYSTKIVFGQNESPTLRELSAELSTGGESWTESDIKNLPRYHAIVSTEVEQEAQPIFTVAVSDFTNRDPRQV